MRRASRDIAIFNLSMMDVVTGAMGAFLIVMVVLARYYDSDPGNKENVEALQQELASARERLREIDASLRRAGIESGDVTTALNRIGGNLDEAEKNADDLREQLDQAKSELDRKEDIIKDLIKNRAFSVTAYWNCPGVDVDIYVWDTQTAADDQAPAPAFDPKKVQWQNWTGDARYDFGANGLETWFVGSSVADTVHKVYIKLANAAPSPCQVNSVIQMDGTARSIARTLSAAEPWAYVARIVENSDLERGSFELFEPTAAEIAAEKKAVAARSGG